MSEMDRSKSEQLAARAAAVIGGGVNSNVRLAASDYFFARGKGPRVWDVDGNEYVDYVLGQGPLIVGRANEAIGQVVAQACTAGMVFGAQHPMEVEAAEDIVAAVSWPDRVRFCMTGSEADHAALRLARAATGRGKVIRFSGHYHGWLDSMLIDQTSTTLRPGTPGQSKTALDDIILLPWDDLAALEATLDASPTDVAAVIMEPVMLTRVRGSPDLTICCRSGSCAHAMAWS